MRPLHHPEIINPKKYQLNEQIVSERILLGVSREFFIKP